jgi:hypothetical protein
MESNILPGKHGDLLGEEESDDKEGSMVDDEITITDPNKIPASSITRKDIKPVMISSYTNMLGPGEYAPEECITISSSDIYMGLPGCFVVHSRTMFSTRTENGVRYYVQHYVKPRGKSLPSGLCSFFLCIPVF